MNNYQHGFLYAASGESFLDEAIGSSKSLKKYCPEIKQAVFTDLRNVKRAEKYFDIVIPIENPQFNFVDKIKPITLSPFDKTIFLDTDTFIVSDISSLFDILDSYDFFACFSPGREQLPSSCIPAYFPEFNSGVIGYNSSESARKTLESWLEIYSDTFSSVTTFDQPALRQALFQSKASIFCLPHEYNFRITSPNILPPTTNIKILHGRHGNMRKLILNMKNKNSARLFIHEARFLDHDSLSFIQNTDSLLLVPLKMMMWLTGLVFRTLHRINKNSCFRKGKNAV